LGSRIDNEASDLVADAVERRFGQATLALGYPMHMARSVVALNDGEGPWAGMEPGKRHKIILDVFDEAIKNAEKLVQESSEVTS
jgi:hypothetical protein